MSISIALMQQEAGAPDMVVMSVTDVTEQLQVQRQLETSQAEQTQLMQELSIANTRLNEVNKELLDANEELQVSNEELLLAHEEPQATIEEFETTNEEPQATNEELETTNDELRARSHELQELTSMLESERLRLSEMVELAPFSILVLRGPRLLIEAYTLRYFPTVEAKLVQNQPLDEVYDHFWQDGAPLVHLVHEVYLQNVIRITPRMLMRVQLKGVTVEHVVCTLVPSHDAAVRVSGVLLYAVDETERRVKDVEEERERLRMIIENTHAAVLAFYDAYPGALIMGSPRYLDLMERSHEREHSHMPDGLQYELAPFVSGEEAIGLGKMAIRNRVPLRRPEVHLKLVESEPETVWDWTITPILHKEKPETIQYLLVTAFEITE